MKKIVLVFVVLLAAPALASVDITAEVGECGPNTLVTVSFDARSEPNLVRAFGLDIQCDNDANIIEVTGINPGYDIYPGTIQINAEGQVTYQGTIAAEKADLPNDTLDGPPDGNGVTIECASLYAPVGPGSPNAPDPCGPLLTFRVDKACNVTITANVSRAGPTGVVMESPDENPVVNLPDAFAVDVCTGPACWGGAGFASGDGSGDCVVNISDLLLVKVSWFKTDPDPAYNPCADFNKDGTINIQDLLAVKVNWFQNVCP